MLFPSRHTRGMRRSGLSRPGMLCCEALLAAILLLGGRSVPTEAAQREVRDIEGLKSAMVDQEVTDILLLESLIVREADWGDAPVVLRDLAFSGKDKAPGRLKKLILDKDLEKFIIAYGWIVFRSLELHMEGVVVKKRPQDRGYYWPKAFEVRSRTAEVAIKAGLQRYPPAGWQGTNLHLICPFDQMPAEGEEHCNFTATMGAPEGGVILIDTVLINYMARNIVSIAALNKLNSKGLDILDLITILDATIFDWPVPVLHQGGTHLAAFPALWWAGLAGRALNSTQVIEDIVVFDSDDMLNRPPWSAAVYSTSNHLGTQQIQSTTCQTVKDGVYGTDYAGPISQASLFPRSRMGGHWLVEIEDGPYECLPWKDVSLPGFDFSEIEGNSCRNPLGLAAAWCFIRPPISIRPVPGSRNFTGPLDNAMGSSVAWAYCDVPICGVSIDDCQYSEDQGASYLGTMNYTENGKPCKPWDNAQFVMTGFKKSNYCGNPLVEKDFAFCLVSDSEFEYCDIPICNDPMPTVVDYLPSSYSPPPPITAGPVTTPEPATDQAGAEIEDPATEPTRAVDPAMAGGIVAGCIAAVLLLTWAYLSLRLKRVGEMITVMADDETTQLAGSKQSPLSEPVIQNEADGVVAKLETNGREASSVSSIPTTEMRSSSSKITGAISQNTSAATMSAVTSSPEDLGYVQLEAILGQGFTAYVWTGKWMGTPCAVKVVQMRNLQDKVRSTVVNGVEMTYARDLSHLHVVRTFHIYQQLDPVHQFGNASMPAQEVTALWMIQELCDMGDLRRCSMQEKMFGRKSEEQRRNTLVVLRQIVLGLTYLHSHGIVHADLKAENVLLSSSGAGSFVAKVADFGMAKNLKGRGTYYADDIIGDVVYMAPEAFTAKRVSPEIDTYSFGILMYELACSTKNRSQHDASGRAVWARPVFPDNIDPSYKELAEQCWQEEPFLRPNDKELLQALDVLIGGLKTNVAMSGVSLVDIPMDDGIDGYFVPNV